MNNKFLGGLGVELPENAQFANPIDYTKDEKFVEYVGKFNKFLNDMPRDYKLSNECEYSILTEVIKLAKKEQVQIVSDCMDAVFEESPKYNE